MFRLGRILLSAAAGILLPLAIVSGVSAQTHTVAPGDSLSYIANLYSVAIDEIVQLNHIANPDLIFSGQKLDIPGGQDSQSSSSGETYTVQLGDTLGQIAARYGVSIDSLARANSIDNPAFIVEGQTLSIPGTEASAPTPQPETVYIPPPPLQFPPMPYDPDIEAIIDEVAAAYGVDPNLVKAVATVESGWTEGAVSVTDARGVMQIMPGTAQYLQDEVFGYPLNYDTSAYDNIKMGVKYLQVLLDSTGGDEHLAVASYYQGRVIVWDAGTYTPDEGGVYSWDDRDEADRRMQEGLAAGKISIYLQGHKLKGSFTLVKLAKSETGKEWLFIKHKDRFVDTERDVTLEDRSIISGLSIADIKAGRLPDRSQQRLIVHPQDARGAKGTAFPKSLEPMQGTLSEAPFSAPDWYFEPKMDGVRAIVFINGDSVRIVSRSGLDATRQYPTIVAEMAEQTDRRLILDGEIVALNEKGVPSFPDARSSQRLNLQRDSDIRKMD